MVFDCAGVGGSGMRFDAIVSDGSGSGMRSAEGNCESNVPRLSTSPSSSSKWWSS